MYDPIFLDRYRAVMAARAAVSTLQDLMADLRRQGLLAAARFIEQTTLPKAVARLDAADREFLAGVEPSPLESFPVVRQVALPTHEQR